MDFEVQDLLFAGKQGSAHGRILQIERSIPS